MFKKILYNAYSFAKRIWLILYCPITGNFWYLLDLAKLKKQKGNDNTFVFAKPFPIFHEKTEEGGTMSGPYFHQDLYVATKIYESNPHKHLDIGSRTDGFVAHVAVFRNIDMLDIREISSKVKNINFKRADLMQLPDYLVESYDSISSLHALEHFGLGRYGDPVDYWGYLKAIKNITLILSKGGTFYFSVPIGPQRIEFNAHRVFSIKYLLSIFKEDYELKSFSFVDDKGDFFEDAKLNDTNIETNCNCRYGCGIFTLKKK